MMEGLDDLVRARAVGRPVDPPSVDGLLQRTIDGLDPVATDDHGVSWHSHAWIDARDGVWTDDTRERLRRLAAHLPRTSHGDGWRLITRRDVFAMAGDDDLDLFLAAMAWGFGTVGYGWRRTARIIDAAGEGEVRRAVACLRDVSTEQGAAEAWTAWSWGGPAKLRGLGTAFASKVAYFASFDRSQGRGPLIADINTAWALWALNGTWDSRTSADRYAGYGDWAVEQSKTFGCRPDDIERALFRLGPAVRKIWKADH